MEHDAMMRAQHPEMGTLTEFEAIMQRKMAELTPQTQGVNVIYNIPVIVHVIHNAEAVGTGANLTQAQVNSQFDVLNEDFSLTNADTTNIPAVFRTVAANCEIHFCPAAVDPQGNILAEPGIDRIDRNSKGFSAPPYANTNYIDNTMKTATSWDPTQYMNIWVMDLGGGLLGYAQFPSNSGLGGLNTNGGAANQDGVVIVYTSFGRIGNVQAPYDLGRTASHEIGHWLGLLHINGDGNCANDFVGDTPSQAALNFGCPNFPQVTCTNGPNGDMFMNYMDYVDDGCMNMFSLGQKARMVTVMTNSTLRVTLNSSTVCNAIPVAPNSNFASAAAGACSGTINFQDQSTSGPTSWSWTFGDGGTATLQNPTHTYTTNGTFTVTLTTANAIGTDLTPATTSVTINMPLAPTVANQNIAVTSGQMATMTATVATGTITWFDNTQTQVGTGTSYTTPPITTNTTYYAQTIISQPDANGGPANDSIATSGIPGSAAHYLIFDVTQACTLKTVKVYAQGAGNRTIQHRNSAGTVINQLIVNLVDGLNVVNLNFPLTTGTAFQLGVDATLTVNLLRNNGGATFPYTVGSYATITGTDVTNQPTYYYYFYDWKIGVEPCLSAQVPVNLIVHAESIANTLSNGSLSLYPNPSEGIFKVLIENNQAADMQIKVFNAVGQLIQASALVRTDVLEQTMNLEGAAKGTYFVQVRVGEQVVYKKYMLQ